MQAFLLILCLDIINFCYRGFLVMKLYEWFIMPVFNSPHIGLGTATGIVLLFSALASKTKTKEEDEKSFSSITAENVAYVFVMGLIQTTIFLAFGFLFQFFM